MQRFWQNMNGLPLSALSVQLPLDFGYSVSRRASARLAYEVAPEVTITTKLLNDP
jgi:hypothetical protein